MTAGGWRRPAILGGVPAFTPGLPFVRPAVPPLEQFVARLEPSYTNGTLTNGPLTRQLEEESAARLGARHAVAVSSCTAGLMLVLQALRLQGPVVVPSFTFSATAHAAAWNGSSPVFAECDPRTFQLDSTDAARRLAGAGALMATHVFGAPCAAERLEVLAADAGLPLVFDAAHAFGAERRGRPVGGFGDAEIFSLSPTKVVVGGEGGVVATDHEELADAVRIGRDYGNPGDYDTRFPGLNARMSELHASLALCSLAELDEHLHARRSIAERYRKLLTGVPGVRPQDVDDGDESTYKDFTVTVDEERFGLSRDVLVEGLRADGIDTRSYFSPPVHLQRSYAGLQADELPVTTEVARRVLSLPLYRSLTSADVDRVVEAIADLQAHADQLAAKDR